MAAVFGLISALAIGLTDLFGRRVVVAVSPLSASTGIQFFALIGTVIVATLSRDPIEAAPMAFGIASGSGMALGLGSYYTGIHRSSATIVAPITATLVTLLPFLYELVGGRKLTSVALIGAVLAVVGLVLITSGEINFDDLRAGLFWGVLSGLGYGGATILFINAATGEGLWPSAGQRLGSLLCLLVAVVAVTRRPFRLPRSQVANAAWAGALTAVTSISMLLGLAIDPVVTTIALSAFPAFAVIVGRIAFGDSITQRQGLGIAFGIVGIAMVSVAN